MMASRGAPGSSVLFVDIYIYCTIVRGASGCDQLVHKQVSKHRAFDDKMVFVLIIRTIVLDMLRTPLFVIVRRRRKTPTLP